MTSCPYTYEKFIQCVFASRWYIKNIAKHDTGNIHKKLTRPCKSHFYHLLAWIYTTTRNFITNESNPCCLCITTQPHKRIKLIRKWTVFFCVLKKDLMFMFNMFFEIDLVHCQSVFGLVKTHINTLNGTSGIDINHYFINVTTEWE